MCGIVAYIGKNEAYPVVIKGLKRLEYRGYDSAGVALLNNDSLNVYKRVGKVQNLQDFAAEQDRSGHAGIGHTRWATHGEPSDVNSHPHTSMDGKIALIHNGIIENYDVLKKELIKNGYIFKSETDTEVVVHLIDYIQKKENVWFGEALRLALNHVVGAYAIVAMSSDYPNRLVAARKSSPLVVGIGSDGAYYCASDATPIVEYTKKVVYLNDEEVAVIDLEEGLKLYDIADQQKTPFFQELELELEALEKGGYEHFMLKEIYEQPESVRNALRGRLDAEHGTAVLAGMGTSSRDLAEIQRIILVGCGTSLHAGQVGEFAFEDLADLNAEVQQAAEFRYRNPLVGSHDLVLAISQSGETADTLAAVREAKAKGALVLGLVNVVGSTIARETGQGVFIHAGPEISVASTKAFTGQVAVLLLMALRLGRGRRLSLERGRALVAELARLPELIELVLAQNDAIAAVAARMATAEHAFFLGRGPMHPVALEGALKLKEISYVHAEGYHAAEMKHGPIALLTPGTPVVVLANRSPQLDKVWSNAEECKARGARIVAVVTVGQSADTIADDRIVIPDCDPLVATIPAAVALQLLAYHVARLRGCSIDQPRNLAKSVTVE